MSGADVQDVAVGRGRRSGQPRQKEYINSHGVIRADSNEDTTNNPSDLLSGAVTRAK